MLQLICGHIRRDHVRNDDICERLEVAPVDKKFVQHRLKWFGHIQRRQTKFGMGGVREERFEGLEYH
jgi:hypothetical protein